MSLKVFTTSFITLKKKFTPWGAGIHKDKTKQKNSKVVEFCFLGCESLTVFHSVPGSPAHIPYPGQQSVNYLRSSRLLNHGHSRPATSSPSSQTQRDDHAINSIFLQAFKESISSANQIYLRPSGIQTNPSILSLTRSHPKMRSNTCFDKDQDNGYPTKKPEQNHEYSSVCVSGVCVHRKI